MLTKTLPAKIKAAAEGDEGVFEAIVATYDVDSVNDQIIPGAFEKTIDTWEMSGAPIPVIWSHKSDDPFSHIGYVEKIQERDDGLWVQGRLDMDEPAGRKVHKLLKGNRIRNFSFAYDIVRASASEKADGVQELHELHLHEVGPCLIGANRATALLGVKNDDGASETTTETSLRELATKAAALVQELESAIAKAHEADPEVSAEKATPDEPADVPASQVADSAAPETKSDEPAEGTAASRIDPIGLWLMELEADAEAY